MLRFNKHSLQVFHSILKMNNIKKNCSKQKIQYLNKLQGENSIFTAKANVIKEALNINDNKNVNFIWVLFHCGIKGNENSDTAILGL